MPKRVKVPIDKAAAAIQKMFDDKAESYTLSYETHEHNELTIRTTLGRKNANFECMFVGPMSKVVVPTLLSAVANLMDQAPLDRKLSRNAVRTRGGLGVSLLSFPADYIEFVAIGTASLANELWGKYKHIDYGDAVGL